MVEWYTWRGFERGPGRIIYPQVGFEFCGQGSTLKHAWGANNSTPGNVSICLFVCLFCYLFVMFSFFFFFLSPLHFFCLLFFFYQILGLQTSLKILIEISISRSNLISNPIPREFILHFFSYSNLVDRNVVSIKIENKLVFRLSLVSLLSLLCHFRNLFQLFLRISSVSFFFF